MTLNRSHMDGTEQSCWCARLNLSQRKERGPWSKKSRVRNNWFTFRPALYLLKPAESGTTWMKCNLWQTFKTKKADKWGFLHREHKSCLIPERCFTGALLHNGLCFYLFPLIHTHSLANISGVWSSITSEISLIARFVGCRNFIGSLPF